jgi:hypothetical protein
MVAEMRTKLYYCDICRDVRVHNPMDLEEKVYCAECGVIAPEADRHIETLVHHARRIVWNERSTTRRELEVLIEKVRKLGRTSGKAYRQLASFTQESI